MAAALKAAKTSGTLFHDLRRSAVRNLDLSGVGQAVAMKITGHKTPSVYQRYRILSESDIRDALEKMQASVSSRTQTRKVEPIPVAQKEVSRPTGSWIVQQLREAFPEDRAPQYLILDRDGKFNGEVATMLEYLGSELIRTAYRRPWQKDYASYCTSLVRLEGFSKSRGLSESFTPCILRGGFSPGSSYKHSFCHCMDAPSRVLDPSRS